MEGIKGYIANIFCIYIIVSLLENIASNEKYVRYIKLFGGVIMVLVVIAPVAGFLGIDGISLENISFDGYEISADVYSDILNAEKGRDDEIISLYCETVAERARMYAAESGYELVCCDAELDLDEDSKSYGKVVLIRLSLMKKNGMDSSAESVFYDYDLVALKNNLANFYNITQSNIYINIYDWQDDKEGIED